ncbi:hypothetical protein [Lysinibacillus parviboronicapiens]|uniref:hypothetical protein n=1 Tax=Lysinibacillus parviboronicapiens TaxID=436516 RepID=UPI000D37C67E|nr:hypothetical protein [Lysinibacillus parviboronicapiens]
MKKYFFTFLVVIAFLTNPSSSKAEVQWDGAQIVKGQTGKMTFTKDVKVYKKNANGTFSSMTVKRNNYFRVYNIEKYKNKTFYWMSSGYRVQATDLVVFKKVPLNIRASFYDNPGYINISRQDNDYIYGTHYFDGSEYRGPRYNLSIGENLYYEYLRTDGLTEKSYLDATDIRIAETTKRDEGLYKLTADVQHLRGPIAGGSAGGKYSKGTVFQSLGLEINGYLRVQVLGTWGEDFIFTYIPVALLQPVQTQGKRYIRYGVIGEGNREQKELKRFDEVSLLTEKNATAWVEIGGETYHVPKKALATIRPNESPIITTSFLPNDTLQQLVYGNTVYKKMTNNRFEAQKENRIIDYHETEQTFNYEMDGTKYIFEKPVTEGSKVTIMRHGMKEEEFVRAIHYTFTITPAGTFNNVVEISSVEFFAPGYGLIDGYSARLMSYK